MANLNSSIINGFLKVTGKLKVNSLEVESNELVSNLNADLLDGKQGSEYASSTDLDNKVNKAGDTMTGTLNGQNIQPAANNTYNLGTSSLKWANAYATTFVGALSGNATSASSATKLTTARTIGVSGVTGTAQSFDGTANIVIPITAVPATLLTNKSAIKGSEITNDKNWVPSSDASVTNFVLMTAEEYATNANSLATGTIVAITDSFDGKVTTQATSLTCDLPLDL